MSPEREAEDLDSDRDAVDVDKEADNSGTSSTRQPAKRRTKTGCLTCRKRRIKCGEERPTCKNCIKSKRECAGYVQPLVYKQHNQGSPPLAQETISRTPYGEHTEFQFNEYAGVGDGHGRYDQTLYSPLQSGGAFQQPQGYVQSFNAGNAGNATYGFSPYVVPQHTPLHAPFQDRQRHNSHAPTLQNLESGRGDAQGHSYTQPPAWTANLQYGNQSQVSYQGRRGNPSTIPVDPSLQSHPSSAMDSETAERTAFHGEPFRRYSAHGFVQPTTFMSSVSTLANPSVDPCNEGGQLEDPDDPYDIELDYAYETENTLKDAEQNLTAMLDRSHQHPHQQTRPDAVQSRIEKGLQTYRPPLIQSPLHDERNERIFCHFVEVISKCMSIYERQPLGNLAKPTATLWSFKLPAAALSHSALAHALLALSALHISKLQHTTDALALKHFTYSVRRVGKLLGLPTRRHEIATLATVLVLGFYEVVSADHSRWNLHLAGAMKLVTEHDFAGPTRVIRRMRRGAKQNISQWAERHLLGEDNIMRIAGIPESLLDDVDWEIDQNLFMALTGFKTDFDNQVQPNFERQKLAVDLSEKGVTEFKAKMDLRWWYCKQDIFQSMVSGDPLLMPFEHWKFCPPRGQIGNADVPYATYDHLLLIMGRLTDFGGKDRLRKQRAVIAQGGQWRPPPGFFPPTLGPQGAAGRQGSAPSQPPSVAKVEQSSIPAVGGNNGPKPSPAPSANEGRVRQSKPSSQSSSHMDGPQMYGMMPPPSSALNMPSSFHAMEAMLRDKAFTGSPEPQSEHSNISDLEGDTEKALAEHAAIIQAFDLFARSLGPDFEPLSHDRLIPKSTPFGPALQYRSPEIACIWALYYVGRILIHRMHPYMPPAAMVSAGVTTHLTREYAQIVGKICAGLYSSGSSNPGSPLDPSFAGALMESTFPLLFAGIQYHDLSQRGWTISKLQDIARMTGWKTSASVAAACEIAWEKLGQAGRGPPYARTLDRNNDDPRVNGLSRISRRNSTEHSSPISEVASEYESQFVSHDRSLIGKHGSTRVHWALGLLSVEEDISKLEISDK